MKIFIYKLTSPNRKIYTGQTYNLKKRLREHSSSTSIVGLYRNL
jgi:predicted GIY-YIG superfamily endonuclease